MSLKSLTIFCILIFFLSINSTAGLAKPLKPEEVPAPLKPWIEWVVKGQEDKRCPFIYSDFNQHHCAWADTLDFTFESSGGSFTQKWRVYEQSWIFLAGEERYWPDEVTINNKPAVVVSRNGAPSLQVPAGDYTIAGRFKWKALPKSIAIPNSVALLTVKLNGINVNFPRVENNRLWLQVTEQKKVEDRFELQVFRHIDDTIPAQITFYLEMQVAGSAREISLNLPISDAFIPLRLQSPLPSRLDSDNKLRLQIRPGRWVVQLTVRHNGPLNSLQMTKPGEHWVEQEVWVYNAHPEFRITNITGVNAIDPQQTLLPDTWKHLPAYRINPDDTMVFNEERRGDPDPGSDNLSLFRTLWLDFEGEQYTIQDQISGIKKTNWRLEMNEPVELGQVTVNGKPQFITQLEGSQRTGVEVRQGNIQLSADSLLRKDTHAIPAVGWNQNFNNVRATLNTPPGYRVFSINGADNVSATWLTRWTLLDIFLVLLITAAVGKLWYKMLGAITLVTLTLIYHEANAPVWIWLFVILGFALLKVLPSGRFRNWTVMYKNLTLIALILITIPFFIQQIRTSLYPQLESYYKAVVPTVARAPSREDKALPAPQQLMNAEPSIAQQEAREELDSLSGLSRSMPAKKLKKRAKLELYDPKAVLQTGPGLPQWQWNTVHFSWSGPVDEQQQVRITYIGPVANALLGWVRVILVTVLILGLLNVRINKGGTLNLPSYKSLTSMLLLGLVAGPMLFMPQKSQADFPNNQMLKELENRLFAPPECLPRCAEAQRMAVNLTPNKLVIELIINSNESVAIPLPGHTKHWIPQKVLLNKQRAKGIIKDRAGSLWLALSKGQHTLRLEGLLPASDVVQLPLPLKPHYVEVSSQGWEVIGVHDDGTIDSQLQFSRSSPQGGESATEFNASNLPPFAQIQRGLHLGLDWRVQTSIRRLSPTGTAIVLKVPLLDGESVTTEGIRVENNHVLINMHANQIHASWESLLSMEDKENRFIDTISLKAPETTQWIETWNIDVSPIWHLQHQGIPVIRHQQGDRWLPQWHPWPGETVTLSLSRPKGVEGQTTTIDYSQLTVTPGIRISNASLSLNLRSSQGTQHPVTLPENSTLQEVKIDNKPIPLRLQERTLLLPVKPGTQRYDISWQEQRGTSSRYATSPVDIGANNVNHNISLAVPRDRLVMFVGGPTMGPAVLFWGVLIVFILAAIALAQFKTLIPLRYWQWVLLSIGLVPISIESVVVVIGWFFIIGARARIPLDLDKWKFNLYQLVIIVFTLITAGTLIYAVSRGLLGFPNMQIYGNGSNQFTLKWYQDINANNLPQGWMVTIPMYVYRILMLLWALWLAFSVIKWSKWFWGCFSTHGYWRSIEWKNKQKGQSPKYLENTSQQASEEEKR